jgi:hypothetical protein
MEMPEKKIPPCHALFVFVIVARRSILGDLTYVLRTQVLTDHGQSRRVRCSGVSVSEKSGLKPEGSYFPDT